MFHYTTESNQAIEDTIKRLENTLKDEGFGVLWQFDIQEKLQDKGVDFEVPYRVLEVCNPHEAKRVLTKDKLAGYFLPCKIVVYDDNGKTKIGMPKPTVLIEMLDDESVKNLAKDIEKRLINCIDNV
ncbi:DUF302 domain-containing protein [Tenuibacillus multivorans]|uniref:Uncharacterized conserved protein, DUF302 family n=1 Tax=Tenuibacillus multivorans TaxID=237069 RepID=A0A1H0DW68_9BACI|nr:DUF302 domain-containing protein [Tenuibacillus multivorans]GEL76756.1 hypothetical protein TMU01_09910 [Tenuibacillus multivorans]SDN74390.1 Uncharacterized conserved protein, DUF302 family [Tenuibacillus multivorans]